MKKILSYVVKNAFILFMLVAIIASDLYFTYNNPFVGVDMFKPDDFEITQYHNPEKVWDKVLFGNSTVVSAYRQDLSQSGYVNLGIDCGKITDLESMLKKGHIKVGSTLAIGMNYLTFYDDFDTNPSYIWHKKWYQPIAYFHRDKLFSAIEAIGIRLKNGHEHPFTGYYHYPMEKSVYYGNLTKEQLDVKQEIYRERYYCLNDNEFDDNFRALGEVAEFCKENNIKLYTFWMPWNPEAEYPELCEKLKSRAEEVLKDYNVEIYDLTNQMSAGYFHDTGHIEFEKGSPVFTEIFDNMAKEWQE